MASTLQNLDQLQAIVDKTGIPTQYFIRFIQNRGGALTDLEALVVALQAIIDAFSENEIIAGAALSGGGKLVDGDVTLDHDTSLVAPGTYGSGTKVPQIVVDQYGHLQQVTEVPVSGGGGGGGGFYDISMGVPLLSTLTNIGNPVNFAFTENPGKALNVKNIAAVSGSALGGWINPAPGSPFHVAVLALPTHSLRNYHGIAIGGFNNANGRYDVVWYGDTGGFSGGQTSQWSSPTNRPGASDDGSAFGQRGLATWLHFKSDGTTMQYGWSIDGANPIFTHSRQISDYLGALTHVFFGQFSDNSDFRAGMNTTFLCYDSNADARVMGA